MGLRQIYSNRNGVRIKSQLARFVQQLTLAKHLKAAKWGAVNSICIGIKIKAIKQIQFENFRTPPIFRCKPHTWLSCTAPPLVLPKLSNYFAVYANPYMLLIDHGPDHDQTVS